MHPAACPSMHLVMNCPSIDVPMYPGVHVSMCPYIQATACLSVRPSIYPSIRPSPSICASVVHVLLHFTTRLQPLMFVTCRAGIRPLRLQLGSHRRQLAAKWRIAVRLRAT